MSSRPLLGVEDISCPGTWRGFINGFTQNPHKTGALGPPRGMGPWGAFFGSRSTALDAVELV